MIFVICTFWKKGFYLFKLWPIVCCMQNFSQITLTFDAIELRSQLNHKSKMCTLISLINESKDSKSFLKNCTIFVDNCSIFRKEAMKYPWLSMWNRKQRLSEMSKNLGPLQVLTNSTKQIVYILSLRSNFEKKIKTTYWTCQWHDSNSKFHKKSNYSKKKSFRVS